MGTERESSGVAGYLETSDKLAVRIRAHTQFASEKLEGWILQRLGDMRGQRLLELGCGDGNYFACYDQAIGPDGLIVGLDTNRELLARARVRGASLSTPTLMLAWDFDRHPHPTLDEDFDVVIAPFSAYYTTDVDAWIDDVLRGLRPGGRILLLGPTKDNASELYALNEALTGIPSEALQTDVTTAKLEMEFLPSLRRRFGSSVETKVLDRRIVFPSGEELARYYLATWLCELSQQRTGQVVPVEKVLEVASRTSLELGKQVICIEARKGRPAT